MVRSCMYHLKFTHEEEKEGSIPFSDTIIIRKPDGSTKLCIYRKPTLTNQYLQFDSHHLLHQKLGVVRTLLDRKDALVTEEEDKVEEENTITQSLVQCGYPKSKWNGRMISLKPRNRKQRLIKTKAKVLWLSSTWKAFLKESPGCSKKHGYSTAMKPHCTLHNILVHPKDKRDALQTAETIYEIPCKNCPKTYIGETGRLFKTRLNEHRTEAEKISSKSFTRSQRKTSSSEIFKSVIPEHVTASNHVIGWDEARVIDLEPDKTTRWLKEAIWIRSRGCNTMNKDEGAYKLDKIYDQRILNRQSSSGMTSCHPQRTADF